MLSTWIETAATGRLAGPVRAGMWSTVVVGTHPIQENQRVWLEVEVDDLKLGRFPAFWLVNKGSNSLWHVPIPPQGVGARLRYRACVELADGTCATSDDQQLVVRPNLPDSTDPSDWLSPVAEALVGNRQMTVRIGARGSTYDVYFPTVGLHSMVRPREGDQPQSRCHFRSIVGGLAVDRRLDWFTERNAWESYQQYQGATNLLTTKLTWRRGPIEVLLSDFVAVGDCLPMNAGRERSPGQYIKRFLFKNEGKESLEVIFALHVQAEINGGIGDVGLSWHDTDRVLLAVNRGHGHANRKLARDATIEFAIAFDGRGDVECEPTGPREAMLLRPLELPAGGSAAVDVLVSGAFTGWSGDRGTFEHWLCPALNWFRSVDLDQVEQNSARYWDDFVEPLPDLWFPKPTYAVNLRRSALAAALHCDSEWGSVASGFDRGLSAYCWPRDAVLVGDALGRLGHPEIGGGVLEWLDHVRERQKPYLYWFQKFSIDGIPEWETPSIDQTALIPWSLERHYRRTGNLEDLRGLWPMVEQAARVCMGDSGGHPGLALLPDLELISAASNVDQIYGAYLYANSCVVVGLRAAAALATAFGHPSQAERYLAAADSIWTRGILGEGPDRTQSRPGLVDVEQGRLLHGRRVSRAKGVWSADPRIQDERSDLLDIGMLAISVPFGLLPAADPRVVRTAELILKANEHLRGDPHLLARNTFNATPKLRNGPADPSEISSVATFWMVRYLVQLGRESGQARHWTRAVAMLDAILGRLSQLGLVVRPPGRTSEPVRQVVSPGGTAWRLHAMLIDTLMDLAGLDYDAVDRLARVRGVLPPPWPRTGARQIFPCGEIAYQLDRPIGGRVHHLRIQAKLTQPIDIEVDLTCPDLGELGPWQAVPPAPAPVFDPRNGRVQFRFAAPAGENEWNFTWG